tara:strand:+ start:585 stop:878 length:294 start_codon:yes stop_codon:yes gene_type:complete
MESRFQGPNGTLFGNKNKKLDKHPDYTGDLELDRDCMNHLINQFNNGVQYPKVTLAGWKRVVKKNGDVFLSIKASVPMAKTNNPAPRPQTQDDDFSL